MPSQPPSPPGAAALADPGFLRANARWLLAAGTITIASSFGQTFFISLFAGAFREEFDLTNGEWGGIYTAATLSSALVLTQVGGLTDRVRARVLALWVIVLYAALCLAMAAVSSAWMLGVAVFGLRFCGQGMMSQIAFTAIGRWFNANRGRAVALAGLGYSLGEAMLPSAAVAFSAAVGWRWSWVAAAVILLCVAAPLVSSLLRRERAPQSFVATAENAGRGGRHWTRAEALRDPVFWLLAPGVLAPPFIGTAAFFHQVHIAEVKGWTLTGVAAAYPSYAVTTVAVSLAAGWAVDRYGATRLLPVYLLPMALGCVLLGFGEALWSFWAALALFGATQGGAVALLGALWPELYGARALGAIRALTVSSMVFATALGPGVTGALIDFGAGIEAQFVAMGGYILLLCLAFVPISARARR